jgi:hypothetical protein
VSPQCPLVALKRRAVPLAKGPLTEAVLKEARVVLNAAHAPKLDGAILSSDNPYQPRVLYLMANFINDVAHENKLQNSVIEQEAAGIDTSGRSPNTLLRDLEKRSWRSISRAPRPLPTPIRSRAPTARRDSVLQEPGPGQGASTEG